MTLNKPPYDWNRKRMLKNASLEDILYELRYRFIAETVTVHLKNIYVNGNADYIITMENAQCYPKGDK